MKRQIYFLYAVMMTAAVSAGERPAVASTNTVRLTTITLRDQHDAQHTMEFPQPRVSVLTAADRKGSEQIESWVKPLKERYGEKLLVEGIADMSSVPAMLRSLVRKRFKEKFVHPVMLDWEGKTVRQLNARPDTANIFVLAANGTVVFTLHGPADRKKLEEIYKVLDERLPKNESTKPVAAATPTGER